METDTEILNQSKDNIKYLNDFVKICKENHEKLSTDSKVLNNMIDQLNRQINKQWYAVEDDCFLMNQKQSGQLDDQITDVLYNSIQENDMYLSMMKIGTLLACLEYLKRNYQK